MNKIVFRQWFEHKLYPVLFSLCLIVSIGAYLTLDTLQQSIDEYISINQKQIVGGDIIVTDNQAFPKQLLARISQLKENNVVYDYQFNAIAYTNDKSLLTRIKAVNPAYPLYGTLTLVNNNKIDWDAGSVLVEQQVLSSLDLTIGDTIQIGESTFKIHDEIINEPDRPLTAFGFGARVIMHQSDLAKTGLIGQKSRVNYRIELKVLAHEKQPLLDDLSRLIENTKITVKTAEQSNTSISNLSQNFLVFLKLLVVAVISLSGMGLMSIVKAFVNKQKNTNAIRTAIGEKSLSIVKSYRILFLTMTLFSVILAWLASLFTLYLAKIFFLSFYPAI